MHKRRIPGSRSAIRRFFDRHGITVKKSLRANRTADVALPLDSCTHPMITPTLQLSA
jgi:hypothetical protein